MNFNGSNKNRLIMKKEIAAVVMSVISALSFAQTVTKSDIPFKMEEITSPKFISAVEKAGGVCVIPIGIIEKHGPHLPLGTDLFEAREIGFSAAKKEYAVVFPPYFTGQIFEAKHQPGAIAYSRDLMWKMLEETCAELARNGLKKIILLNGHGGNNSFLQYFCQAQLTEQNNYVVVFFRPGDDPVLDKQAEALKKAKLDGHAGEEETSMMYVIRPDLVDIGAIKSESGLDQDRLKSLQNGYTGIWWYAKYPNHYASDIAQPSEKLGQILIEKEAIQLAGLIKFMKSDNSIVKLQDEFFKKAENPLQK
jgi:creatinine amidohydrolase